MLSRWSRSVQANRSTLPGRLRRFRPLCEILEDRRVLTTFDVTNTNDSGTGSLRQAILDANGTGGADTILFKITTPGPHIITLDSDLPTITEAVEINGPTAFGAPKVRVDGDGNYTLFVIQADNVTIRGLSITGSREHGILIDCSNYATIEQNWIGLKLNGEVAGNGGDGVYVKGDFNIIGDLDYLKYGNVIAGNTGNGVTVEGCIYNSVLYNFIGTKPGSPPGFGNGGNGVSLINTENTDVAGNVISANAGHGVYIAGFRDDSCCDGGDRGSETAFGDDGGGSDCCGSYGSYGNRVYSNFIGTNGLGTQALGNGLDGIHITGLVKVTDIGGPAKPELGSVGGGDYQTGNIIADSGGAGIRLVATADGTPCDTWIMGNYIGVSLFLQDLGNTEDGIAIEGATKTLIGDESDFYYKPGNRIAFNGGDGVHVTKNKYGRGTGNAILGNSIYANAGLGINLGTAEDSQKNYDPQDPDRGPNHYQNAPVLTYVDYGSYGTTVFGFLNSLPDSVFRIEFFGSFAGDPEGRFYLGHTIISTGDSGVKGFSKVVYPLPGAFLITATATLLKPDRDIAAGQDSDGGDGGDRGEGDDECYCGYIPIETSEFSEWADLALTKTVDNHKPFAGDTINYTITVTNNGPSQVSYIKVEDCFPDELDFLGATPSQGSYDSTTGIWILGPLKMGESATLIISALVPATEDILGDVIVNKACIKFSTAYDPKWWNDCDYAVICVDTQKRTDLAVSIVGVPQPVFVGNTLTYVATVKNNGPFPAPGNLAITLDPGTVFLGATPAAGWVVTSTPPPGLGGTVFFATTSDLAVGATSTFFVDVLTVATLPNGTVLTAKAVVSTTMLETTLANNVAFAFNTVIDDTDGTGIPPGSIGQVLINEPAGPIELIDNRTDLGAPPTQIFLLTDVRLGLTNNIPFFERNIPTANTSGIINGVVFEDANGNGSRDLNEVVLDGMVFYLTRLRSDDFDESRPVATTGRDGDFRFEGLAPGVYVVRPVPNRFYNVSFPQEGFYQVVVSADRSPSVTFGVRPIGGRRRPILPSSAAPLPSRGMLALDELLPADSCLAVPLGDAAAEVALRDAVFCAELEAPPVADDSTGIDWLAPVALASLLATTLIQPRSRERDRRLAL